MPCYSNQVLPFALVYHMYCVTIVVHAKSMTALLGMSILFRCHTSLNIFNIKELVLKIYFIDNREPLYM